MSLAKNFCSSPWFHMRITNTGDYDYCRWMQRDKSSLLTANIRDVTPAEFFQKYMSPIRSELLLGNAPASCADCYQMESYSKVSGRQRQLLKTGIEIVDFNETVKSSPYWNKFLQSLENEGTTDQLAVDWQVDLGNFCNSSCVFCTPHSSSKIAAEYLRLGVINKMPPRSWCDDPELIERFVQGLEQTKGLTYIHFLGGETIITPAFKIILQRLVDSGLSQRINIGFTTNLTVWDDDINQLLVQFKSINLGLSIECLNPLNEYLRYPSKFPSTQETLGRWVKLGKQHNWIVSLRVTPTLFSVLYLDQMYDYAYQNSIDIESCNFLRDPATMRISVLPADLRKLAYDRLNNWVAKYDSNNSDTVINTKNSATLKYTLIHDAKSYLDYLLNAPDETHRAQDLVIFLKMLESSRGNSILDYAHEHKEFLRSAGY